MKIDKMLLTTEGEKELKKIKKDLIDKQNADNDEERSYAGTLFTNCRLHCRCMFGNLD